MDGLSSFAVYTPMYTPPNLTAHLAMPSEIPILFSESYGYLLLALGVILGCVSVCILPAGGVCCITLVPTCCVMVMQKRWECNESWAKQGRILLYSTNVIANLCGQIPVGRHVPTWSRRALLGYTTGARGCFVRGKEATRPP